MTLRGRFTRALSGDGSEGQAPASSGGKSAAGKRGTTGKMRRAKPPNVIGRGPLLDSEGLGVAIVCIVKDEAEYLEEWLGYHFALGVGHVFIYDNGSSDGSAELLERYQNHGLVTVIDWPLGGGQLAAYNHALRFFGSSAEWLAFYDVDEFLVPLLDDDIPALLKRFDDTADVRVERKEFGFSGHRARPDGLTIDAYTDLANVLALDPSLPPRVKSIVRPETISAVDVHLAFPADVLFAGAASETAEVDVRGVAQLNHYYTRSFEEFEAKRFRGSATGRIERPRVPFDVPTIATDTAVQRFSERTLAMIEHLRSLEPRPYYYGSDLKVSFFPRPNDLGRFAEFALANTAAGLDEPQRIPARRVKNLHAGIGLVGDLDGRGYQPEPGDLARSIHTAVLVEHMRGRLEGSIADDTGAPTWSAVSGELARGAGEARSLRTIDTDAQIQVEIAAGEMLRCYALGFVLASPASAGLDVSLEREDGSRSATVNVEVPASAVVAGIIEIEPLPQRAARVSVSLSSASEPVEIYDLFLISYG